MKRVSPWWVVGVLLLVGLMSVWYEWQYRSVENGSGTSFLGSIGKRHKQHRPKATPEKPTAPGTYIG